MSDFISTAQLEHLAQVIDRFLVGRPISHHGPQSQKSRPGSGLEFLDHRPYSAGDDPRFIDWRMTMKQQEPYIKRYQNEAASNWVICLDNSASMNLHENEKWQLAVKIAAAWAFILLRKGQRVSLLIFADEISAYVPPGRGKIHYGSIVTTLRKSSPHSTSGKSNLKTCIKKIRKHWASIVISDFAYPDAFAEGLSKFSALCSDVHAFTLTSSKEFLIESDDAFVVEDVETGQKTLMNSVDVKKKANLALRQWYEYLEKESLKHGIVNSLVSTDKLWNEHLLEHFKKIQRVHA